MVYHNLVDETLGQYHLHTLLGSGGMGSVYLAQDNSLKRKVAIKVIASHLSSNKQVMARFTREATISAKLEHPNIAPVYGFGTAKGVAYVAMRYLTGGSLARRLEQRAKAGRPMVSLGETADLLRQIGSALDYAHGHGIIHRDIKPANIMFDNQGVPYIIDFGVAKLTAGGTTYTQEGATIGTPNYMPPEQWQGKDLSPATDQYALAVVVYQLLAGRVPFDGDSAYVLMNKHINETPPDLRQFRPNIPVAIIDILNRALHKDPQQRFPSCHALAQAFESAIGDNREQTTSIFTFPVRPELPLKTVLERPATPISRYQERPTIFSSTKGWFIGGIAIITVLIVALVLLLSNVLDTSDDTLPIPTNVASEGLNEGTEPPFVTNVPTVNVQEAALATRDYINTQTAQAWTHTPTPNNNATIEAQLTQFHFADLTATAQLWTPIPSTLIVFQYPQPTQIPKPSQTPQPTQIDYTTALGYSSSTRVNTNQDWQIVEQTVNNVVMVMVPTGCFMMGSSSDQINYAVNQLGAFRDWLNDEQPAHLQCFDEPFWIDKYEVTQAQFRQLGGIKSNPNGYIGDNYPVDSITWYEASNFCQLRGGRLPTEAEWEYAARGVDSLIFPWGNTFVSSYVIYKENHPSPANVGSRSEGISWVGAYDLAGNAWEYTSSYYAPYPYTISNEQNATSQRVIRGGAWVYTDEFTRSAFREGTNPSEIYDSIGFRCVMP